METTGKTVPVRKVDVLKDTLKADSVNEQFRNALGANSSGFVASIIDLYTGDPQLQSCEPNLVVAQALKAAVLKLPINKALGFAYIVVYNNNVKQSDGSWLKVPTPTFMPGYKGYIQLAMRTGQYRTINADVVYEGEFEKVNKLTGEVKFDGKKISDKVVGYFAYFELLNGFSKTLYIDLEKMCLHAKRYSSNLKFNKDVTTDTLKALANSNQSNGSVGWQGNFQDMALKTCVRNLLSKYGYLSVEMMDVVTKDHEDSEDERNKAIAEIRTTGKSLNIEEVDFSEVKQETPAVTQPIPNDNVPY